MLVDFVAEKDRILREGEVQNEKRKVISNRYLRYRHCDVVERLPSYAIIGSQKWRFGSGETVRCPLFSQSMEVL